MTRSRFRHEDVSVPPRGWRVRTVTRGGHQVRVAFPPGPRRRGAGRVVSILHPAGENPRACNPWDSFRHRYGDFRYSGDRRPDGRWTWEVVHPKRGLVAEGVAGTRPAAIQAAGAVLQGQAVRSNPAYSAYFVGRRGTVSERYFRGRSLLDAKRQSTGYARAHGLAPSTLWQLRSSTRVGRRFAGEWARPLTRKENDPMELWLDNPKRRRHHRRRHNAGHHRRHRHGYNPFHRRHHRHRHNPELSVAGAFSHPGSFVTEAAIGLGGVYGIIVLGNWVGNMLIPTMYTDPTMTGKFVRAATRTAIAWAGDQATRGLAAASRSALRMGIAVGIVGSFLLDLLGSSFTLGAGDQLQTVTGVLGPIGLSPSPVAGLAAYINPTRRAMYGEGIAGIGAYVTAGPGHRVSGLGDLALSDLQDRMLYHPMR